MASAPAYAADSSAWDAGARSGIRLIAGNPADNVQRAGVEMKLASGWKTYWRYPGDSGVPPRFDFTQSENVKEVTVLWPAPQHYAEEGGYTIGYKNRVTFPLRIVALDPNKPVVLRLKLDYAVCEKLCVPAEGKVALPLDGAASPNDAALAAAEARVPKAAALGDGKPLAVRAVHRDAGGKLQKVVVDVAAPENDEVELFAEGPTESWALPLPMPVSGAPAGQRRFVFDLDALPAGVTAEGVELTLTAVVPESAIEVKARLD